MPSKEFLEVVAGNSRFANKFYNFIAAEEKGKNVFFSPISAHAVLAMAYQGAAGKTANAFASTLHVGNQEVASTGYNHIMKSLKFLNDSVEDFMLHIANKIYIMHRCPLKKKFHNSMYDFFSEAELVNFAKNVESAKKINVWVEEKTNSKIKDLISADCLDSLTRLVLVNAIYFKGNWQHQFEKRDTLTKKFYISDSETVDCRMMRIMRPLNYRDDEELDAQILEMKYTNENVSMVIILPRKRNGIEELEKKLVNVDLSTISKGMKSTDIEVSLPKFKIETTMDLNDVLSKMGLGIIFQRDKADFSEISEKSTERLYVTKAIHKAFIEVNEEGTEAYAAKCFLRGGYLPTQIITFTVDHPFLILLQAQDDSVVHTLFYGKIVSPVY